MANISYQVKSKHAISVNIPEEYANDARNLVEQIMNGNLMEIIDSPYLGRPGILSRAVALSEIPSSKRLQNALYLRVCINQNEKRLLSGQGNLPASDLDSILISLVHRIEAE